MSVPAAPPVPRVELTLSLPVGSGETRVVDLATRALVVAVVPPPRWGREAEVLAGVAAAAEAGADLVEVPAEPRLLGPAAAEGAVPVVARVAGSDTADAAIAAGAALALVSHDRLDDVVGSGGDRVAVLVDTARAGRDAVEALPTRPVALDVTRLSGADAVSEESLALAVGVRLIRTADLRRTRRVVEVMAHLLEARR